MTADSSDDKGLGVELNGLRTELDDDSFPRQKAAILTDFGDHKLEFSDGETTTVATVLEPVGVSEFQTVDDVIETIYQMVGRDAVGPSGQTGRGTSDITPPPEDRPPGQPGSEEDTNRSS